MKKKTIKNTPLSTNPMEQLLQKSQVSKIKKGEEIQAKIISLSKSNVLFDIEAKAYAVLGNRELKEISTYIPYLKIGDKVKVRIIAEESKEGFPVVSMQRFFEKGKWDILINKKNNEEEIEVLCGEYGKGGVFIDFMGIRGVIPKIQLIEDFLNQPQKLDHQKIKVKILEVDQEKNRLVVSQKAAVFKTSHKQLQKQFDDIQVGKTYKARILGTSGLIHISEISWEKVSDVSSYIKTGEMIDVMVVEKNTTDLKLNLSLKRLSHDPWKKIEERFPKDKEVDGEIIRKERYGYFIRLEPGVEGLIHISKLTGKEELPIGKKIKAYVEKVDEQNRRMSLVLTQKEKPVTYR